MTGHTRPGDPRHFYNRHVSEEGEDRKLYKIGEVCKMADVQPYVLRYWETEFPSLAPNKSGGGQRLYTRREIDIILRIKQLLYSEGFTIAGAKKKLEGEGESPAPTPEPAAPKTKAVKRERDKVLSHVKKELQAILKILSVVLLLSCNHGPTEPRTRVIADGRWSSDGACLTVRSSPNVSPHSITLIAGCGHGELPLPEIRDDGSFDVDGTYRIEAGPVSIDPPPPAHYSGVLTNTTLTLRVQPSNPSVPANTFVFHMDPNVTCAPRCL
jgi:DNA-binding transcriptional MerR regulator